MEGLELFRFHAERAQHYHLVALRHRADALEALRTCPECWVDACRTAQQAGELARWHALTARTARDGFTPIRPRPRIVLAGVRP